MESGRWIIKGNWLERKEMSMAVKGKTIIAWSDGNWFTMVTKLVFPSGEYNDISFQYRGHLDNGEQHYTYVCKQSLLGRTEGEGRVGDRSIIQRYWVLDDRQRRSGFEAFHQLNDDTYLFSGGILAGYYLTATMEAVVERQS